MKATIKITQRMLNKSIIDANKSVQALLREHFPEFGYDTIPNGSKRVFIGHLDDGKLHDEYPETEIRLYRRPRGDCLMSIQGLNKRVTAGDILTIMPVMWVSPETFNTDDEKVILRPIIHINLGLEEEDEEVIE